MALALLPGGRGLCVALIIAWRSGKNLVPFGAEPHLSPVSLGPSVITLDVSRLAGTVVTTDLETLCRAAEQPKATSVTLAA
jgi:hypothetical protein